MTFSQEQIRLGQLEREAEASRLVYETFLTTFTQANEVVGLQEADVRVVSYASPPRNQSAPNTRLSVVLGMVGGVFAGMGLVLLSAFRDRSIDSIDKLRQLLVNIPVVTTLPKVNRLFYRSDPLKAYSRMESKPLTEAVRTLRNTLMLNKAETGWSIAVISALPNEGKTTTSLLLAQAAVQAGKVCLVVETDLRRGSIAQKLDMPPGPDLTDVLSGRAEIGAAVYKDEATGTYILRANSGHGDPGGALLSSRMEELIKVLRTRFDLVVFDTPPLLSVTDALPIIRQADDLVLVARSKRSTVDTIQSTLDLLSQAGVKLTCAVLTMARGGGAQRYNDYY